METGSLFFGWCFVIAGGLLTAVHLSHLMADKLNTKAMQYRIMMTLAGGILIGVGANLIAAGIHDRLRARN